MSCSLLHTGEPVCYSAEIIDFGSRINGGPSYSLIAFEHLNAASRRTFEKKWICYLFSDFRKKDIGLMVRADIMLNGCKSLPVFTKDSMTGVRCTL